MKAIKHHQTTLAKFCESSFLKMATKFLLLLSVFSVIVSCSPLLPFLFSFSAYIKKLLGLNIDKNYMFLLCNGILVFIVKNSGIINKSQEETDFIAESGIKSRDLQQQVVKFSETKESIVEKEVKEVEEAQDTQTILSVAQDDEAKDQEHELLIIYEEEEEEEGVGLLSTEELNKKCDDFIRKMKLGIKFEAQQLIVV